VVLGLGRRGEYAVRLALQLARQWPEGRAKARDLAEATDTPGPYAAHVLADLVRAGLVASTAGRAGGYEVARPPHEISILEVVEAVGAGGWTGRCVLTGGPCTPERPCTVHDSWEGARSAFTDRLASADLATLLQGEMST
jgi:Rrf2 family transcriptional regulator, iron-sulfur cluster assembly transcription factor